MRSLAAPSRTSSRRRTSPTTTRGVPRVPSARTSLSLVSRLHAAPGRLDRRHPGHPHLQGTCCRLTVFLPTLWKTRVMSCSIRVPWPCCLFLPTLSRKVPPIYQHSNAFLAIVQSQTASQGGDRVRVRVGCYSWRCAVWINRRSPSYCARKGRADSQTNRRGDGVCTHSIRPSMRSRAQSSFLFICRILYMSFLVERHRYKQAEKQETKTHRQTQSRTDKRYIGTYITKAGSVVDYDILLGSKVRTRVGYDALGISGLAGSTPMAS